MNEPRFIPGDIMLHLAKYPPETLDGTSLRNVEHMVLESIRTIQRDYETHKDRPEAMAALKELWEPNRIAYIEMARRIDNAIMAIANATIEGKLK